MYHCYVVGRGLPHRSLFSVQHVLSGQEPHAVGQGHFLCVFLKLNEVFKLNVVRIIDMQRKVHVL